jgi:hypothetical protein
MCPRTPDREIRGDERSSSVTLNYVLVLGITAILVSGLILAGGVFVENQRDKAIRGELTVIGTHLASNVEQVDRYVQAGEDPSAAYVNQTFQRQATGQNYDVRLEPNDGDPGPPQLVLTASSTDVTVRVNVSTQTDVSETVAQGGTISVFYYPGQDAVVIQNA